MSTASADHETEIDELRRQIQRVASESNLGKSEYDLHMVGNNVVFQNLKDRVVARIAPAYMAPAAVNDNLAECRSLERSGAPVLPALRDEAIELPSGRWVTFWPLAKADPDLNGCKLAKLAGQLHCAQNPIRLVDWTPQQRIKQRLWALESGRRDGLPAEVVERLRQILDKRLEALESAWQRSASAAVPLHGDFYYGNIVELDNRLLLCDLDELCRGPREVDLATIQISCRHYLEPDYWNQFLADYPADYDRGLLKASVDLQTIGAIIWQASFWESRPAARIEFQRRLDNLDDLNFRWHKTSRPN